MPGWSGITLAPAGTIAWRRLFSGIARPREAKMSRMCSATSLWNSSSTPMISAMASRVMSSWVGPSPPQQITASERSNAWRMVATMRAWLSPTLVW